MAVRQTDCGLMNPSFTYYSRRAPRWAHLFLPGLSPNSSCPVHHFFEKSTFVNNSQSKMYISFAMATLLLGFVSAQTYPECTREVARTDDCAAVINANACYNKFRWNAQTLTCIDGTDNAAKAKKVSSWACESRSELTWRYRCASVAVASARLCAIMRRSRSCVDCGMLEQGESRMCLILALVWY
jgi:hypothetical protein